MTKASKAQTIQRFLTRSGAAALESRYAKIGRKPHSVHAFLSGLRKAGVRVEHDGRGKGSSHRMTPRAETGNENRS